MFCGQFVRSHGKKGVLSFPRFPCVPGSRVSLVSLVSACPGVVQTPEIPRFWYPKALALAGCFTRKPLACPKDRCVSGLPFLCVRPVTKNPSHLEKQTEEEGNK